MKKILFSTLLLIAITCSISHAQRKHIHGTNISLVVPEGYTKSQNFLGYEKDSSQLSVMTINGGAYNDNMPLYLEQMSSPEIIILEDKELTIDGYPAKYIVMTNSMHKSTAIILIFGNDSFTNVISGASNHKDELEILKRSILSAEYIQQ
ncbi:hypothetical protein [Fulvivirga ligni]|uniref:hypothetical protein n=1 Tax=Fulvivirga ligni TaxID=2904246 RepID=UPI001F245D12|nr:hypothetical protein [Fulvivirga ligni]UII19850.1 hypothetical protein LVD16_18570 [Fulvivirga ligni]